MICCECGAHTDDHVTRGPLGVQLHPPMGFWRGRSFHLSNRQAAIMHQLVKNGAATHLALELVGAGEDAFGATTKVQITFIRKKLPPNVTIECIRAWGYKLIIDEDEDDSSWTSQPQSQRTDRRYSRTQERPF